MNNPNRNYLIAGLACLVLAVVLLVLANPVPVALAQATNTPTNTPTVTNTPTNTPTPTNTLVPLERSVFNGSLLCRTGNRDCIQSRNGGSMRFYDSTNKVTFSVDPATGNVTLSGTLSIGGTPYATPTAVPTRTCGTVVAVGAATVVHPYNTPGVPQLTLLEDVSADGYAISASNNVSHSLTINVWKLAGPTPAATGHTVGYCLSTP